MREEQNAENRNVECTNNVEDRKAGKYKNRNEKTRDIDILGLCEIRWPDNGDFWSDDIRVIHTNSTKGQAGVGIALNNKWGN